MKLGVLKEFGLAQKTQKLKSNYIRRIFIIMMQQMSAYEACKTKLRAAEMFHKRSFSQEVKNTAAVILKNTIGAYEAIAGTPASGSTAGLGIYGGGQSAVAQMDPIGSYKNFIIKIASLGIPALDVFDWVAMEPMATASTQILFTRYVRMSNKGKAKQGDIVSDPFGIMYRQLKDENGNVIGREDATDTKYSSALTSNAFTDAGSTSAQDFKLTWTPVRENTLVVTAGNKTANEKTATAGNPVEGYDKTFVENGITVSVNYQTGAIQITTATASTAGSVIMVAYEYDNVYLPANDIPTYGATVEAISMVAKPHKVRIVWDALSNLIYKNDYGIDIAKELPKKAVEDFMYSIATEVSDAIIEAAPTSTATMSWSLAVENGWIAQHYASFGSVLAAAQAAITKVTKIYAGNRCFIGTALVPVVMAIPGFKQADTDGKIGTQLIGTLGNLKIYYKPDMDDYTYVVFAKGNGTELSVGLLSMYMAALPASIVPTQLLEFADGLNSQGFYSLYDFKILNPILSVKGVVSH